MLLRKRTRSQQKTQQISHLMSDAAPSSDVSAPKHEGSSFFNIPGLFLGLNRKSSESDSLKSPTSTLDLRVFSNVANPFKKRSPNEGSQKTWDCSKVGLSIIDSLEDEPKTLQRSGSKSVVFGPQMRIQMPSFSEASCTLSKPFDSQNGSFGSHSYQDSFGKPPLFEKGMNPELPPSQFIGESSVLGNPSIAPISPSEIKNSEDYTCVRTHTPNPKVTHIFGDCILEWDKYELANDSKNGEGECSMVCSPYPSSDFLSFCHYCKKVLDGEDIYIYRGEKAFCSCSCRSEEILIEEKGETSNGVEDSEKANFGEEFSCNGMFIAI